MAAAPHEFSHREELAAVMSEMAYQLSASFKTPEGKTSSDRIRVFARTFEARFPELRGMEVLETTQDYAFVRLRSDPELVHLLARGTEFKLSKNFLRDVSNDAAVWSNGFDMSESRRFGTLEKAFQDFLRKNPDVKISANGHSLGGAQLVALAVKYPDIVKAEVFNPYGKAPEAPEGFTGDNIMVHHIPTDPLSKFFCRNLPYGTVVEGSNRHTDALLTPIMSHKLDNWLPVEGAGQPHPHAHLAEGAKTGMFFSTHTLEAHVVVDGAHVATVAVAQIRVLSPHVQLALDAAKTTLVLGAVSQALEGRFDRGALSRMTREVALESAAKLANSAVTDALQQHIGESIGAVSAAVSVAAASQLVRTGRVDKEALGLIAASAALQSAGVPVTLSHTHSLTQGFTRSHGLQSLASDSLNADVGWGGPVPVNVGVHFERVELHERRRGRDVYTTAQGSGAHASVGMVGVSVGLMHGTEVGAPKTTVDAHGIETTTMYTERFSGRLMARGRVATREAVVSLRAWKSQRHEQWERRRADGQPLATREKPVEKDGDWQVRHREQVLSEEVDKKSKEKYFGLKKKSHSKGYDYGTAQDARERHSELLPSGEGVSKSRYEKVVDESIFQDLRWEETKKRRVMRGTRTKRHEYAPAQQRTSEHVQTKYLTVDTEQLKAPHETRQIGNAHGFESFDTVTAKSETEHRVCSGDADQCQKVEKELGVHTAVTHRSKEEQHGQSYGEAQGTVLKTTIREELERSSFEQTTHVAGDAVTEAAVGDRSQQHEETVRHKNTVYKAQDAPLRTVQSVDADSGIATQRETTVVEVGETTVVPVTTDGAAGTVRITSSEHEYGTFLHQKGSVLEGDATVKYTTVGMFSCLVANDGEAVSASYADTTHQSERSAHSTENGKFGETTAMSTLDGGVSRKEFVSLTRKDTTVTTKNEHSPAVPGAQHGTTKLVVTVLGTKVASDTTQPVTVQSSETATTSDYTVIDKVSAVKDVLQETYVKHGVETDFATGKRVTDGDAAARLADGTTTKYVTGEKRSEEVAFVGTTQHRVVEPTKGHVISETETQRWGDEKRSGGEIKLVTQQKIVKGGSRVYFADNASAGKKAVDTDVIALSASQQVRHVSWTEENSKQISWGGLREVSCTRRREKYERSTEPIDPTTLQALPQAEGQRVKDGSRKIDTTLEKGILVDEVKGEVTQFDADGKETHKEVESRWERGEIGNRCIAAGVGGATASALRAGERIAAKWRDGESVGIADAGEAFADAAVGGGTGVATAFVSGVAERVSRRHVSANRACVIGSVVSAAAGGIASYGRSAREGKNSDSAAQAAACAVGESAVRAAVSSAASVSCRAASSIALCGAVAGAEAAVEGAFAVYDVWKTTDLADKDPRKVTIAAATKRVGVSTALAAGSVVGAELAALGCAACAAGAATTLCLPAVVGAVAAWGISTFIVRWDDPVPAQLDGLEKALGFPRRPSEKEARKAYRIGALDHHPDKKGPGYTKAFQDYNRDYRKYCLLRGWERSAEQHRAFEAKAQAEPPQTWGDYIEVLLETMVELI